MPQGLSQDEANKKLKEYGYNEIVDVSKITPLGILFRQVRQNYIVYLLSFAAAISFLVGKNFTAYTIIAVIASVIVIGFIQEFKAEQSISNLKKMLMPITIAYRDGRKREVPSRELVPEDVVVLGNGEKIPADCELIESYDLRLNESALTGESKEISKKILVETNEESEENKLFMGTYIVNGRCLAKVTHTGMNTKFGKIAHLISTAEKDLPLQQKINAITKYMVVVAVVMALATSGLVLLRSPNLETTVLVEVLILAVAIAVSAFPEGFPVVLITTLAIGAKRMSERNAVVNRMSIIETLGETTVICSDKTGTITRGEMTVKFIFTGENLYEVEGGGYIAHGNILKDKHPIKFSDHAGLDLLIEAGINCTDAEIERVGTDNEYRTIGTPTEAALLILGAKVGKFKELYNYERESENPFNSERKMMSVLLSENGRFVIYAKGAPEVLLIKCSKIFKNGQEIDFSEEEKNKVMNMQVEMSDNSYRTLVIACKNTSNADKNYAEEEFTFLGIVAMEDPPREEVFDAVKTAEASGIRVIMITGDNKGTAISIGKQIGILGRVMEGKEMDELSDEELKISIKDVAIFARVRPDHKIRLVNILKDLGEIVAMTGDGVNDAPALKEAHIGIAMGKNGTDVSRSASDLILKDDNFATIIGAIAEGRTVFNNLRKFVTYQLGCNLAELTVLFFGVLLSPLLGWQTPILVSIQILFMNLVTDNLPAITLGLNPSSADIMKEKPRKNGNILNKALIKLIITTGSVMASLTLFAYYISFNLTSSDSDISRTTALATLILLEIATAFSFRSFRKTTLDRSPLVNKYLVYAASLSFALTLAIIYTPLKVVFETASLDFTHWAFAVLLTIFGLSLQDFIKLTNTKNPEYLASTK